MHSACKVLVLVLSFHVCASHSQTSSVSASIAFASPWRMSASASRRTTVSSRRVDGDLQNNISSRRRGTTVFLTTQLLVLAGCPLGVNAGDHPQKSETPIVKVEESGREFGARTIRQLLSEQGGTSVLKFNEPQRLVVEAWSVITAFYLYQDFPHCGGREGWALVLRECLKQLDSSTEAEDAAHSVIAGKLLVRLGDRYAQFLQPQEEEEAGKIAQGEEIVGLGVVFVLPPGAQRPKVLSIMEGSEAQQAGVQYGDTLLAINGRRVGGQGGEDAGGLIPGAEGTRVSAQLQAAGGSSYTVSLARVRTSIQPLTCKLIQCHTNHCYSSAARISCSVHGGQVLYARISTFLGPPIGLRAELQKLVQGNANIAQPLLLDIRGNTGGSLTFADKAIKDILSFNFPNVVALVDGETASAAEYLLDRIMSASKHVGTPKNVDVLGVGDAKKTFGKGEAQAKFELSDSSAVEVTVSRFLQSGFDGVEAKPIGACEDPVEFAACFALQTDH